MTRDTAKQEIASLSLLDAMGRRSYCRSAAWNYGSWLLGAILV